MSEAPPPIDDDEAALAELAGLDMALARHVNAQALATTDPDTLNGLVRSAQRMARSIRQSIAAKARLKKEQAAPVSRAPPSGAAATWPPPRGERGRGGALFDMADLEAAALPRIRAEYDPSEAESVEDDLADVMSDIWTDDFADLPLHEQVESLLAHIRDNYWEPEEDSGEGACDEGARDEEARDEEAPDAEGSADPEPPAGPEPMAPLAETPAEAEPPPEPDPSPRPPDRPPPEPYVPPWEQLRPGQRFPGGSGW